MNSSGTIEGGGGSNGISMGGVDGGSSTGLIDDHVGENAAGNGRHFVMPRGDRHRRQVRSHSKSKCHGEGSFRSRPV